MSFSKTALKKIKALTKNELVDLVIKTSNYAENQKAQNIILLSMVSELKKQVPEKKEEESK
jgi:hypothetical protein